MLTHKALRTKGKLSLTKYFQKFKEGDYVAIVRELTMQSPGFPKRIQGRTGIVIGTKGSSYVITIKDYDRAKQYIVKPIHLRRIQTQ
ncbi:50S ribosomal protein L21e [Candidatus Pacearchaeota archaeon]|nr:50S ribosomal protein L21e [Candidatus Pacearchaeota archaeon]